VAVPGGSELAVGPAGSLYLLYGLGRGNHVTRVSASGEVLWTSRIAGAVLYLRTGPDGTLYVTGPGSNPQARSMWGAYPWVPVATPDGRPLSLSTQSQRTLWAQPLSGGLELVRVNAGYDSRDRRTATV
jgi:hypothetical protein